ncbi:MAT1-1-1 [Trichoderma evansii]
MMSREEMEKHLSVLRTDEILRFLRDDTLLEIAERYFTSLGMNSTQNEVSQSSSISKPISTFTDQPRHAPADKAKRPLNAFMAFRSYYLRLFPEVQQKTASGFLTTLWNKDSYRNKWALVAKVYSFVRDQIGRDKVSLSYFLNVACPIMKITEPSVYLSTFGWSVEDEAGSPKLIQTECSLNISHAALQSDDYPNTENDLLSAIINVGYLPDDSVNLMERMSANSNGIMTTASSALPVLSTKEKTTFMKVIEADPFQAARELLGPQYEEKQVSALGVKSHLADDLDSVAHLPLQFAYPDPRQLYNYASVTPQHYQQDIPSVGYFTFNEDDALDVDNPWDIDKMLGYNENEGDRATTLPTNIQYNPHDEFFYTF